MINKIHIKRFKSIMDLSLDLGRFNVIIGENGCGKTNVLEAISFAAAANQEQLSNDYIGGRIRFSSSELLYPAFITNNDGSEKIIELSVHEKGKLSSDILCVFSEEKGRWFSLAAFQDQFKMTQVLKKAITIPDVEQSLADLLSTNDSSIDKFKDDIDNLRFEEIKKGLSLAYQPLIDATIKKEDLNNFQLYCPEESSLRKFDSEAQITPLGQKGEGLFRYLKELSLKKDVSFFETLNKSLHNIDWYLGFKFPDDSFSNEFRVEIVDKYINDSLHFFDQRSTNEGFLYLLFYYTLFYSKQTPSFFAIDNIESSLNPKLTTKLVSDLVRISKDNGKQVILTTHCPFVLDALDLWDDEIRLFVAKRNMDGYTQLKRIEDKKGRTIKLSEVWMKGMIGGLPENF